MRFSFGFGRGRIIRFSILLAAAMILFAWVRFPFPILAGYGVLLFLLLFLDVRLPSFLTLTPAWTVIFFILGPVFTTLCVQHIILDAELFAKTSKAALLLNMACIAVVYLLLLAITAVPKRAFTIAHIFFLVVAFVDYYVYEFRQNELTFADIRTIRTGLNVAKSYRIVLNDRGTVIILLSVLVILFVRKCNPVYHGKWARLAVRMTSLVMVGLLLWKIPAGFDGRVTHTWEKKGSYRNGFVANFILGFEDSFVDKPDTYSPDVVALLEEEYLEKEDEDSRSAAGQMPTASGKTNDAHAGLEIGLSIHTRSEEPEEAAPGAEDSETDDGAKEEDEADSRTLPTIITIMDESFADFRVVGALRTNIEVTPFIDSLKENTVRGFALASVYGAKTPNSEWEYLTGHTMAFLPSGSVVYEQYLDNAPYSLVGELRALGYTAVAMHPYYASGWKRNTVYPKLGFEEQMFLDTGDFDESSILREYITDQELFDKIIDRFEQKDPGEPLYVLGITMQNHGGYTQKYDNFRNEIYVRGSFYADANQYLSLIHKTDQAVKNLITYFSEVEEPVVIVFFGDHLPSLSNGFYKTLNGHGISGLTLTQLENLFKVPFFIWTNYDTQEEEIEVTSLNYLSTLTLKQAGIPLTPYHEFLSDLMEEIPAINAKGYYSKSAGKFLHLEDAEGSEQDWIEKYHVLEYNAMFDQKNRSDYFFPYYEDLMLETETEKK